MCLAGIELCATIPLSCWLLSIELRTPIYQWAGLADLHYGFSRVQLYPYLEWILIPGREQSLLVQPWLTIACAICFFLFFGLAEEARTHYRLALTSVAKRLGLSTGGSGSMASSGGWGPSKGSKLAVSIPSFVQRSFVARRTSIGSFSDKLSTDISIGDLEGLDDKPPYSPYSPADSLGGTTMAGSPAVGDEEKKNMPIVVRPDSGVVVDIEVITDRRSVNIRRSVDVPQSVRDSSHIV